MNIWPSPGKGPTRYYEFTQCLFFKCTTFTSPIYHLPINHGAFAHAVTFREENFSSSPLAFYSFPLITLLLIFIFHTSQLYRVSDFPWTSRYKVTFWVKPQVQLRIYFQFWKWTRASFLDSGPYNSRGLSGLAQDHIFSTMLNNWHALGAE